MSKVEAKFQVANIIDKEISVSEPFALKTHWDLKAFHNHGAGADEGVAQA